MLVSYKAIDLAPIVRVEMLAKYNEELRASGEVSQAGQCPRPLVFREKVEAVLEVCSDTTQKVFERGVGQEQMHQCAIAVSGVVRDVFKFHVSKSLGDAIASGEPIYLSTVGRESKAFGTTDV